jgi:hypothetical protein
MINVGDRVRLNVPENSSPTCRAESVQLGPGGRYRFCGVGKGPGEPLPPEKQKEWGGREWAYPPGDYRLVGVSYPVRFLCTGRQEIVCEGLEGAEAGRLYHCPLEHWSRHFTLIVNPPPEKVLDQRTQGSGC